MDINNVIGGITMTDSRSIIGDAHWEGCETCIHAENDNGCDINSEVDDFHYSEYFDAFICENYEME